MSKFPKIVLEGAKYVSRTVLSPDNDDIGIVCKFVMKKGSFSKRNALFYQFLYNFDTFLHIFLISFIKKRLHHRNQQTKLPY